MGLLIGVLPLKGQSLYPPHFRKWGVTRVFFTLMRYGNNEDIQTITARSPMVIGLFLLLGLSLIACGCYGLKAETIPQASEDRNSRIEAGKGERGAEHPVFSDDAGVGPAFIYPKYMARDSKGNFYLTDSGDHTVKKITPDGLVTIVAGTVGLPGHQTVAEGGNLLSARLDCPCGICVDSADDDILYVSDQRNNIILRINLKENSLLVFAGIQGLGSPDRDRFYFPTDITMDSSGYIYVLDMCNWVIKKIDTGGRVSVMGVRKN